MICFQFSIFELPGTTYIRPISLSFALWFAFNSVYLNYREQRRRRSLRITRGCDLLSIQYIWTTGNNLPSSSLYRPLLWFAFNSVYLNYREQPERSEYNRLQVVICFQFSIFELPGTTDKLSHLTRQLLWFAFNSVYLNYREQPKRRTICGHRRCDLLSIQYIWTTGNNQWAVCNRISCVVICFQFSIFELPGTTQNKVKTFADLLWFAFNSVYLNYREQLLIRMMNP